MFEEIRLASFVAKAVTHDPTALPARKVFEMATSMGARALHIDHLTGSLEPGKRADLVLVDLNTVHNLPQFNRDPDAIYARLIYAAKSTDVTDVMVDGRWLMQAGELKTLDVPPLLAAAADYAKKIDAFLVKREGSVLSKLIAIGGAEQQESYEVQIKVRLSDPDDVIDKIMHGPLRIMRRAHYLEYDTYFEFDDLDQGRLRHREDDFVDDKGEVSNVRYRLTLIGPAAEREFPNSVLLSRSRFIAPATNGLRFYREYFKPENEFAIHKDRLRWLIQFDSVEFFINVDRLLEPRLPDSFLEIKARTWSRRDAEEKVERISDLLEVLGLGLAEAVRDEYIQLATE
jgi:5-methylthioadenosine/S-adenosylhomocysteine deaminase